LFNSTYKRYFQGCFAMKQYNSDVKWIEVKETQLARIRMCFNLLKTF
jgi:hypothetical protein